MVEQQLSAEQRGNVTAVHRELIEQLRHQEALEWSSIALLGCLQWLCTSRLTVANEVRVENAWTDGPDAFCVVYRPPYGPELRIGIRSHRDAGDMFNQPDAGSSADDDYPDPLEFGRHVADFNIGEPLGSVITNLRGDEDGVGWWGSLGDALPVRPQA